MTDLKTFTVTKNAAEEWVFDDGNGDVQEFDSLEEGLVELSPCAVNFDSLGHLTDAQQFDHAIFIALLAPVKEWLESGAHHEKRKGLGFNMNFVSSEKEPDYDNNMCGTAMCIGGAITQFNKIKGRGYTDDLIKLQEKFETIQTRIYDLFYPYAANADFGKITPTMALKAIENFEKHCDPLWKTIPYDGTDPNPNEER